MTRPTDLDFLLRCVVMDYGQHCDDPAVCSCSLAQLTRYVATLPDPHRLRIRTRTDESDEHTLGQLCPECDVDNRTYADLAEEAAALRSAPLANDNRCRDMRAHACPLCGHIAGHAPHCPTRCTHPRIDRAQLANELADCPDCGRTIG